MLPGTALKTYMSRMDELKIQIFVKIQGCSRPDQFEESGAIPEISDAFSGPNRTNSKLYVTQQ